MPTWKKERYCWRNYKFMLENKSVPATKKKSFGGIWILFATSGLRASKDHLHFKRVAYHPLCVSSYLAVCAIGVAHRHKDLREELLGLLLCVLLLCYTSGCIWGQPQITRISERHGDTGFSPQLNWFLLVHRPAHLKKVTKWWWISQMIKKKGGECRKRVEKQGETI